MRSTSSGHPRKDNQPASERQISDTRLEKRLENKAYHYLGRYSASTAHLETILRRFALRKIGEVEPAQLTRCIHNVIRKCTEYGYIDDKRFIRNSLRQARQAGQSQSLMVRKLTAQGLDELQIRACISEIFDAEADLRTERASPHDVELLSALGFAKKKKLGCFSPAPLSREEKNRQLARLARRGFSYDICNQIFTMENAEEAEEKMHIIEGCMPHHLL